MRAAAPPRFALSRDEAERLKFWSGRKAAFPAVGRILPDYFCMDGTIPRKRLGEVLSASPSCPKVRPAVPNVFHAGDGNLHPLIMFDANDDDQLQRSEAFGSRDSELCIEVGGTITGEHGVGIEKINEMCVQFSPRRAGRFHRGEACVRPARPAQSRQGVPTLHRCAEFGRCTCTAGRKSFPSCLVFENLLSQRTQRPAKKHIRRGENRN